MSMLENFFTPWMPNLVGESIIAKTTMIVKRVQMLILLPKNAVIVSAIKLR